MDNMLAIVAKAILISAIALASFYFGLSIYANWNNSSNSYDPQSCNIAVIQIFGEIMSYTEAPQGEPDYIATDLDTTLSLIKDAELNKEGILLKIDSPGGSPVASETISNTLKRLSIPTASLIRSTATSAAYHIATGTDTIIASIFSDIGSIAVTMSYLDNSKRNELDGFKYNAISSGKFKDSGSPDRPLSVEERALFERDINFMHKEVVREVAENRNLPIEDIAKIADGSSMNAGLALQNKLIVSIGDIETARAWFAQKLNIPLEEVEFCY